MAVLRRYDETLARDPMFADDRALLHGNAHAMSGHEVLPAKENHMDCGDLQW